MFFSCKINSFSNIFHPTVCQLILTTLKSVNSNFTLAVRSRKFGQAKTHFLSHVGEKKRKNMAKPGLEPTISRSEVDRVNHYSNAQYLNSLLDRSYEVKFAQNGCLLFTHFYGLPGVFKVQILYLDLFLDQIWAILGLRRPKNSPNKFSKLLIFYYFLLVL